MSHREKPCQSSVGKARNEDELCCPLHRWILILMQCAVLAPSVRSMYPVGYLTLMNGYEL